MLNLNYRQVSKRHGLLHDRHYFIRNFDVLGFLAFLFLGLGFLVTIPMQFLWGKWMPTRGR